MCLCDRLVSMPGMLLTAADGSLFMFKAGQAKSLVVQRRLAALGIDAVTAGSMEALVRGIPHHPRAVRRCCMLFRRGVETSELRPRHIPSSQAGVRDTTRSEAPSSPTRPTGGGASARSSANGALTPSLKVSSTHSPSPKPAVKRGSVATVMEAAAAAAAGTLASGPKVSCMVRRSEHGVGLQPSLYACGGVGGGGR